MLRNLITAGLLVGLLTVAGCFDGKNMTDILPETWTAKSPGQTAREAFNVYDADLRRNSVNSLAAAPFGGEEPYLKTYRLLLDDPDPTVRAACAHALGLHGTVIDANRLIPRLQDETTFVRWEVAKALQRIHNEDAVQPLINTMKDDPDPDVRMSAAAALGQYPDRNVYGALIGALDDQNYSVALAANRSLRALTGQDFSADGAKWLTFAKENPKSVFQGQRQYTWMPYQKPRGWFDKMQVWKEPPPPVQPRVPTGTEGYDEMQLDDGS